MRLTSPYRIIFLYPKYQKIISASSLSGILLGVFFFFQFSVALATHYDISANTSLWTHPEGVWWFTCVLTSLPLLCYGCVLAVSGLSGMYLVAVKALAWSDFKGYVTQSKFPQHWFEKKPWF